MEARSMARACTGMAIVLVAAFLHGASAQPPSSGGCTSALVSLSPCLNYITGNETTASSSCCSQLKTVVQAEPQCLCVALSADPASVGISSVNRTRALGLPGECGVQTPPITKCNNTAGAAGPTAPSSGGGGSKATPTANPGSDAVSVQGSVGLVLAFVAVAVFGVSAM